MSEATSAQAWTTRRLLAWIGEAFTKKGLDSPRLCAEILVAHVLGCERLALYMEQDRPASEAERERLRGLVGRALKHEPIQYLVGEWPFFGMAMKVDSRVLIPRACTELIVERVVQDVRARLGAGALGGGHRPSKATVGGTGEELPAIWVADVCTGSGCIAVAIAKQLASARVMASDVSAAALEVARLNASRHGVAERVEFFEGDGWGAFGGRDELFDYVVSNPPYIPDYEWDEVGEEVKGYEPHVALRGGTDGMLVVRPVIEGARGRMKAGGLLLVETAASTAEVAAGMAREAGFSEVRVLEDHEGLPRVVEGRVG